jgi:hypothetical protein
MIGLVELVEEVEQSTISTFWANYFKKAIPLKGD